LDAVKNISNELRCIQISDRIVITRLPNNENSSLQQGSLRLERWTRPPTPHVQTHTKFQLSISAALAYTEQGGELTTFAEPWLWAF
jgi:hypothetical protein